MFQIENDSNAHPHKTTLFDLVEYNEGLINDLQRSQYEDDLLFAGFGMRDDYHLVHCLYTRDFYRIRIEGIIIIIIIINDNDDDVDPYH